MGKAGRAQIESEFNLDHEVSRFHRILQSALAGQIEPVRPAEGAARVEHLAGQRC